jgi:hypothetical protein
VKFVIKNSSMNNYAIFIPTLNTKEPLTLTNFKKI